ncbi:MAG TPA: hypothetical protein VF897_11740, partial [Roseiflexaceae bacterium]
MKKVLQFDTADNRLHQVDVLDGGDLSVFSAPNAVPKGNADGKLDSSWIDGTTGGSTSSGGMENPMRAGGDLVVGGPQQLLNYASAAQGATVTAREQWGNYSPAYAIDGNDATPWESNTP